MEGVRVCVPVGVLEGVPVRVVVDDEVGVPVWVGVGVLDGVFEGVLEGVFDADGHCPQSPGHDPHVSCPLHVPSPQ